MSSTFQKKLTGDIYAIVSEFNQISWLGLRKCFPTKGKFYVGKQGVNLDFEQFTILRLNYGKIMYAVSKKKSFNFELGFNKMGLIDKSTCFTLKLTHGEKDIFLDFSTLKKLEAILDEIESEILQMNKKIQGNVFKNLPYIKLFIIYTLQRSKWKIKKKRHKNLVIFSV